MQQPYGIVIPDWDEEAIETARDQAAMLLDMDANDPTAHLLLDKARLAERRLRGEDASTDTAARTGIPATQPSPEPFDPMRLCATLGKFYGWSDTDIRAMPMKRLLAYKREADRINEEEQAAYEDAKRANKRDANTQAMLDGKPVDPAIAEGQLRRLVTTSTPYAGATVPVCLDGD